MSDVEVDAELEAVLRRWSERGRTVFAELMEDATSALQRELVQRAVLAGHSPGEVHAFADELRGLSDDECFEACTVESGTAGATVALLLKAEADPLYAFQLKGGALTPNEHDDAPSMAMKILKENARAADAELVQRAKPRKAFAADSGAFRALPPRPVTGSRSSLQPVATRLFEELLTEATRPLGVSWREHELDTPDLSIEQGLQQAASSIGRGVPVPAVLGNAQGKPLAFVVMLQTSSAGATRAFQLFEHGTRELVWANERDLIARGELPFENKALRRLLRIALPRG